MDATVLATGAAALGALGVFAALRARSAAQMEKAGDGLGILPRALAARRDGTWPGAMMGLVAEVASALDRAPGTRLAFDASAKESRLMADPSVARRPGDLAGAAADVEAAFGEVGLMRAFMSALDSLRPDLVADPGDRSLVPWREAARR